MCGMTTSAFEVPFKQSYKSYEWRDGVVHLTELSYGLELVNTLAPTPELTRQPASLYPLTRKEISPKYYS